MKKISNEAKVGILAIVSIIVLVLGFNFLKGTSVFSKTPTLFAEFNDIGDLQKSNTVKINGLDVGTVYDLKPKDKEVNTIIAEIHLSREVLIPKNSVAFIDGGLLGGAFINIAKGDDKAYLAEGATISTRLQGSIMSDLKTQVAPTLARVNSTLDTLTYTIGSFNQVLDPNTKNNLRAMITNLTLSSASLQQLLNAQGGLLAQGIGNLNSVTGNLARNNDAITSSIRNVEVTTSNLANANIQGMVAALQATVSELQTTIKSLNSKEGTIGLLTQDRELYDRLNGMANRLQTTALSAEILIDDIRVNPKRYLNFSVFGKKDKGGPLTSPVLKDTVAVSSN